MTDDQFTQLFKLIQEVKDEQANLARTDDVRKLADAVHDIAAKFADHDDDHKLTDNILKRHEQWIQQIAKKSEIELSY